MYFGHHPKFSVVHSCMMKITINSDEKHAGSSLLFHLFLKYLLFGRKKSSLKHKMISCRVICKCHFSMIKLVMFSVYRIVGFWCGSTFSVKWISAGLHLTFQMTYNLLKHPKSALLFLESLLTHRSPLSVRRYWLWDFLDLLRVGSLAIHPLGGFCDL